MNIIKLQFISAIIILTAGVFVTTANAVAPTNDNLANAVILPASGAVNGTTVEATRETGEFSHTITSDATVYRTVWYQLHVTTTKPLIFTIDSASSGFDPSIAVYTGENYPLNTLAINNDTNGNLPYVEIMGEGGTTYKIAVGVYNNENAPGGDFHLIWEQVDNPTNDNFAQARNLQNASGNIVTTNQNATAEPDEPIFSGPRTIWFNYTNPTPNDYSLTFDTRKGYDVLFDTNLSVFTGATLNSLSTVVRNDNTSGSNKSRLTFLAKAGVTYHIAVGSGTINPNQGNIILNWDITKVSYTTGFGTDLTQRTILYPDAADITVFRPSNGVWYSLNSSNNDFRAFQFGSSGDTPVAADYDGDGLSDYAVTRSSNGLKVWYIRSSFDETYTTLQWGLAGDREVPGDYDHDGRMDIAVFRPSNNVWYILKSSDRQFIIKEFGLGGDIPVLGDFKGTPDGSDLAVFRPSNGTWYIFDGVNTIFAPFGTAGDKPVPSDYDLDGKTDLAVFRPSNGTWYYLQSVNDAFKTVQWGLAGDIPMIGDYDANSNDLSDFAVFRPSDSTWYILKSEGTVTQYLQFGLSGDIPASSLANLMQ
jgi:hypothetical protein